MSLGGGILLLSLILALLVSALTGHFGDVLRALGWLLVVVISLALVGMIFRAIRQKIKSVWEGWQARSGQKQRAKLGYGSDEDEE